MGLQDEIKQLQGNPIKSVDDLWEAISQGGPKGIVRSARLIRCHPYRLIALLAAQAAEDSELRVTAPIWERGFSSLLIPLLPLLAIILLVLRVQLVSPPIEQVVVATADGLTAGQLINATQVTSAAKPPDANAITSLDEVVGGYLLKALAAGEVIHKDDIIPKATLAERDILPVTQVQFVTLGSTLKPGDHGMLWFYPREPGVRAPDHPPDVILLALSSDNKTASITVAAYAEDIQNILPLLGKADVYLIQSTLYMTPVPTGVLRK